MVLPRWIPFVVAFWVIAFGILRLRIALSKNSPKNPSKVSFRRGGFYARSKRVHMVYGVLYLILGGYCIAMGFGYQIDFVRSCNEQAPTKAPQDPNALPINVAQ